MTKKAVFLDRDGVINELVEYDGALTAPRKPEDVRFKPNVREAISLLKDHGFKVFVVTNQPGIGTGEISVTNLDNIHEMIRKWFKVDAVMYCDNRRSPFYKPGNGMLEHLISKYQIERSHSFMVGDRWKDIHAGVASGLTTVLVGSTAEQYNTLPPEQSSIKPHAFKTDILDASVAICELEQYISTVG